MIIYCIICTCILNKNSGLFLQEAYKFVASLHGIDLKRAWSLEAQEDAVLHVLTRLYNCPGRLATPAPAPLGSASAAEWWNLWRSDT